MVVKNTRHFGATAKNKKHGDITYPKYYQAFRIAVKKHGLNHEMIPEYKVRPSVNTGTLSVVVESYCNDYTNTYILSSRYLLNGHHELLQDDTMPSIEIIE